jgi:hypothetical protein
MYGLRPMGSAEFKPFLNDPLSQCAPYAVSLLAKARKNILRGNISIYGNEYMQPGEVIYLEQKGLLFYVEQVNHSMSMGGQFRTDLTVTHGHYPGEYIPTQLDVFGKMAYNNANNSGLICYRDLPNPNEKWLGTLQLDPNMRYDDPNIVLASLFSKNDKGDYTSPPNPSDNSIATKNINALNNIMASYESLLQSQGTNIKYKLEIRYYTFKGYKKSPEKIKEFSQKIKEIMIGTSPAIAISSNGPIHKASSDDVSDPILIDLSKKETTKSPSNQAWSLARDYAKKSVFSRSSSDADTANVSQIKSSAQSQFVAAKMIATTIVDIYFVRSSG